MGFRVGLAAADLAAVEEEAGKFLYIKLLLQLFPDVFEVPVYHCVSFYIERVCKFADLFFPRHSVAIFNEGDIASRDAACICKSLCR